MKIIADQNIPFVEQAFSSLGEIIRVSGAKINKNLIKDADILLVRSVTTVNEELLAGSSVKFVATATIGTDHIDKEYLTQASIGFSSAPGSNANSVVEYVLSAIINDSINSNKPLEGKTIAIVGVGNIGSILYNKAKFLGMIPVLNDPPRSNAGGKSFRPLNEVLPIADYVSIHTPLSYDGNCPTFGLVNDNFLSLMKDSAVLINASRGKTIVEEALIKHAYRLGKYILDVWPSEPSISPKLLESCQIATPHIAGYSFDGKASGTEMIYFAACNFFFAEPKWSADEVLSTIKTTPLQYSHKDGVLQTIASGYNILNDDKNLQPIEKLDGKKEKEFFQKLRREYPKRYEFKHYSIEGVVGDSERELFAKFGFQC
jgi:erythronate-4-phosphate dehydrogenase